MKLFKKLAAAALAAVLALAMVGCGSSASLKDELLKMAMDQMTVAGGTANHSKELDALWRQSWCRKRTRLPRWKRIRTRM